MTITHTQQTFRLEFSSSPPVGYNHLGRVEIILVIGMNIVFLELSRPQTKTEGITKLFARKSN